MPTLFEKIKVDRSLLAYLGGEMSKKISQQLVNSFKNYGLAIATATLVIACGETNAEQNQPIKVNGSSTVYPITQAISPEFTATKAEKTEISVDFSGTGGGFQKFCAGQTDIN